MGIQHIIIHEIRRAKADDGEDIIISNIKNEENDNRKIDVTLQIFMSFCLDAIAKHITNTK